MTPLIECVPNFSEGRRQDIIDLIVDAMARAGGVSILNVDSDADHNRTVVTLVGLPQEVEKSVFAGVREAIQHINLDDHEGVHPRFGAADVIPFVPIRDITLDECVSIAHRFGMRLAKELGIPVYFYEAAAMRPDYQNLSNIRVPSFQYEQLREVISTDPNWIPDIGDAELGPAGASLIGARMPLIAFNVFLNSNDLSIAQKIARTIRYSSGGLRFVKSSAFMVDDRAQVSMNLTDYQQTPLHQAFEMIRREAQRYGVSIVESELIGLILQEALFDSARWYMQIDNLTPDRILENAILNAQAEPTPLSDEEPPVPDDASVLVHLPDFNEARRPEQFANAVAQPTLVPAGGAVAGHSAALAAALAEMVASVTIGKRGYDSVEESALAIRSTAFSLRDDLTAAVERDVEAFESLMEAIRHARDAENDESAHHEVEQATLAATHVPLEVARMAHEVLQLLRQIVAIGNHNAVIDAAVGVQMATAAIESSYLNVRTNLLGIADAGIVARYTEEIERLRTEARKYRDDITQLAMERAGLLNADEN